MKMWAIKYHQMLLRKVPKSHPDMGIVLRALHGALKDYKMKLKQQVMEEKAQLEEMKLSKELRDLYLVQQGIEAAGAPEAQLPAQQGRTARGYPC